ncbi:hypothetical protein D049_2255A, partial [Vibrio parahaemolyticus VPTS-2010]
MFDCQSPDRAKS